MRMSNMAFHLDQKKLWLFLSSELYVIPKHGMIAKGEIGNIS